ncbi:MAG: TetR/AcrR family transcriptional regulator [Clostridia bacterium]|nr:TetR/AcrR family transcriptional regulator [Clostridia bacterium]
MPKIIENLRNDILSESLKIIEDEGVDRLSIRHLSSRLDIAPSTVYNYYDSKEQIVGALIKMRWEKALDDIDNMCRKKINIQTALSEIVENLRSGVRPLLQFHIASVTEKGRGEGFDFNIIILEPLNRRIKLMLSGQGYKDSEAEKMAPVLSRLLITCMYDVDLGIDSIIETVKKI